MAGIGVWMVVLACGGKVGEDTGWMPAPEETGCEDLEEVCNGVDDNCNGVVDEELTQGYYADADGDGFGDPYARVEACTAPPGYVVDDSDCDDSDPTRYPGAPEECDGADDDCNGIVDDELTTTMFLDLDRDTYGDPDEPLAACKLMPGLAYDNTDCDDTRSETHPGADEICDALDNDCDGEIDEDPVDTVLFYQDADYDGYGSDLVVGEGCFPPPGQSTRHDDCDDADAAMNPAADDFCDGVDQDCDGIVDDDHRRDWMFIGEYGGVIYEIDPDAGTLTWLSEIPAYVDFTSVDVRQSGQAWSYDTANETLNTFDPCTGDVEVVGSPHHGHTGGIVFRGDELYGVPADADQLVQYNLANARPTYIGPLGIDVESSGVAYDCTNDLVYGVDSDGGRLFKVDLATGTTYDHIDLGRTFEGNGLEFDDRTGMLLLSDVSALWSLNPLTGELSPVGDFGLWGIDNLAFHPTCP